MRKTYLLTTLLIFLNIGSEDGIKHTTEITNKTGMLSDVPSKIRRCKSRILYYANHIATFQLILCGNIKINPSPTKLARSQKLTRKCTVCSTGIET